jgi:Domain of unknown function (DUF4282)
MPDQSPHQDLPEDWNRDARAPFSPTGASDGYGAGTAGSHRARTTDGYGTGPTDAYGAAGAAKSDALGTRAVSYGAGATDAFGIRPSDTYGAGAADPFADAGPFGAADPFGPRAADPFGPRAADPFGPRAADPFGPRAADPFGPRAADPFEPQAADPFAPQAADPFALPTTGAFGTKPAAHATVTVDAGTARPDAERPVAAIGDPALGEAADLRGFVGALFDFGFTSFVTPKVIRVLYMLIAVGTVASALVFTIIGFRASVPYGIVTLVFGDPLFILIVLAICRVLLEFFVVTFRTAEDIRAMRERGDPR